LELCCLGALLLLTRWRLRPAAAATGALAFAFGLYPLSWLVVPLSWVVAAAPWALYFLVGALRGDRRHGAASGLLLGALAGWCVHPETAAFLWLAVLGSGVVLGWGRVRRLRRLVPVLLLGVAVAGVGALPTLAAVADSARVDAGPLRYPMPYVDWKLRARAAGLLVVPWREGHPADGTWQWPFPAAPVSLSVGALPLALLGMRRPRRRLRRVAVTLVLVGSAGAVLVFQLPPLAGWLANLPVLGSMVWPRAGFLPGFALACLAALAADAFLRRPAPWRAAATLATTLAVAVALAATGSSRGGRSWSAVVPVAVSTPLSGLLGTGWTLPLLVLGERCAAGWGLLPGASASATDNRSPILAALRGLAGSEGGRLLGVGPALPPNLAARLGFADLRALDPVRPHALASLHQALGCSGADLPGPVTRPWAGLAGAWGVRWLVAGSDGVPASQEAGWDQAWAGPEGRVYRNHRALPVVRVASRAIEPPGSARDGEWEGVDFASTAVVSGAPRLSGSGEVTILEQRPRQLRCRLSCTGTALAVFHAPRAVGWATWVDDRPAPIVEADCGAMGVIVPAGEHVVTWRYTPPGLVLGSSLTLLGLAGCAAYGLGRRRGGPR
jgi:hypothetical protein